MKFLYDLFPLICFFVAYSFGDIYLATAAAIVATVGQVLWLFLTKRKVGPMLWMTLFIVVVFGGLTIYLHDNRFILWKPTVLYWLFSVILAVSATLFKRNLIRSLMSKEGLQLPDAIWGRLNWAWVIFFALTGMANLYVAFNFPESIWVKFKTFGMPALMFVFVAGQVAFFFRHIDEKKP